MTKVVARGDPFQFTTEVLTKLEPLTVSVNCGLPALALLGLREVATGTG